MTAPTDLSRLDVGQRVQDPLLVLEVEQRGGDTPHTILLLGNSTGRLATAPFWAEDQPRIAGISRGDVVQVIGELGRYRDQRQLKVSSIRPLPKGSVELSRLVPAIGDPAPYWKTLDGWREEITRPRLAQTLALFYHDHEFRAAYEACPASLGGHHAMLGGLLKHTVEVATIARAIARVCRAEQDVVLAGVLLHDIGKLEAYRWEGGLFEATEAGTLHGHVVLGTLMLDRRVRAAATMPCTGAELAILHHLILSHHGRLEFGAAVPPLTLEAEVLHYADNASAKTASMADALADPANFEGDALVSARTLWQLDRRRAYRGKSDWGAGEG
jgi:3'-5' exoribonuclease